ncbi:(deoxy)nucleoside triphosphate pyrophosphohydrolase [Thermodesulfatator atlanticus]|uniref:(deoxy)nucleoside triphosphate pyrophosphohydrolase n=1 Tax=Thermodesulfatator atlanticus TaxID=501497 RepID=UPI0003B71134|nr:(deoxy)nucleoside triphosphate pyrophosphohydrolase [Thermodesulfatator atlanticus]
MKHFPVVAAFLKIDGKILLTKRPLNKKRGGLWEFPGGKLEAEESLSEALVREIKEELGLEIRPGEVLLSIDYDYPDVAIRLFLFSCDICAGEPHPLEGQKIGLFSPEDIERLLLAPADRLVWEKLKEKGLAKNSS